MPATPAANASTAAHLALAKQMAEEGSVLLKNDGSALPLTGKGLKIAVIGPTASATPTNGVSAKTVCSSAGEPLAACSNNPGFVAPFDAITTRAKQDGDTVTFDNGSSVTSAAAAASAADVSIVFGYYTEGEGADRTSINLDDGGDALISAVAAANPNTIVVLETGSAVLMPWLSQVKSVLEAWYPGVQQGPALAALLFGDADPSGHLPVTFPQSTADLPTAGSAAQYPGVFANGSTVRPPGDRTNIRQVNYTEGLQSGHSWYDAQGIAPLFPFGYGLSYTTFTADHLQVTPTTVQDTKPIRVRFKLTNTGQRAGTQVEQVYLTLPAPSGEPPKRLVGWARQWALTLAELRSEAHKTAATVRMVMSRALAFMADPALAASVLPAPGGGFDIPGFLDQAGTVYLIAEATTDDAPVAPLFAAMAAEIHHAAAMTGQASASGRLDPPLLMGLDEVTQICPVPLPSWLSDSGGKGIQVIAVVHGQAQLAGRWDDHGRQVVLDTCSVKVFLPGITDTATLEAASTLCGQASWQVRGRDHAARHEVATPDMIRQLPAGFGLVIRGDCAPVIARLPRAWNNPAYRRARHLGHPLTHAAEPIPHPELPLPEDLTATRTPADDTFPWS